MLADAVQAADGKLYILGGGWDTLYVSELPARHPALAIGLRVRIPSTQGDRPIRVTVDLHDADGRSLFPGGSLVHEFTGGRPAGFPEGSDVGVVRALTFQNLGFENEGSYSFVISIDGEPSDRLSFLVRKRQ